MTRSVLAALLCAVVALPFAPAAGAPVPAGATWTQAWFPSQDGTMLHADVLLPSDRRPGERHPVILSIGPYFGRNALNGSADGPIDRFRDLWREGRIFERGYAWVQVDSRGFGASDGCNDFGGPGEQQDVEAAVNWAATRAWSNGNVGMWGKSYDAWTQVMALAENPVGLRAAVIQAPLIETYRGMFLNGVHYASGWYLTPSLYAGYDLAPVTARDDPRAEQYLYPAKGTATNPHCYAENIAMTTMSDRTLPYWRRRDIVELAGRSRVPVIWAHGVNDVNTKPDNFLPVYERLAGPKRAWIGQWDHVRGNESYAVGRSGFIDEAMDWFDHHLKGMPLVQHPPVEVQNGQGWWRTEDAWPPEDATHRDLPLKPGAYLDERGHSAAFPNAGRNATWTFTQPAPHDLHLAGTPRLEVTVETSVPNANLVVIVYEVLPDRLATTMTRGAYLLPGSGTYAFDLFPQDWVIEAGSRIGILIAGDDATLFTPVPTNSRVQVTGGSLSVPFLRYRRASNLEGDQAPAASSVPRTAPTFEVMSANTVPAPFPPPLEDR